MKILSVDIGTTAMKMGVYRDSAQGLELVDSFSCDYEVNIYNDGLHGDIEPEKWQRAFLDGCRQLSEQVAAIEVISLSGTTPGLTAMGADGEALAPAILMLDQRSRAQAAAIIERVGLASLLEHSANVPVAGGCSLASILWIRENLPEVYHRTRTFGHSNSFFCGWLTGRTAIDPSSASLTALYNTVANDLRWNKDILAAFDLTEDQLPPLCHAHQSPGRLKPELAALTGLRREPPVLIGGNDAVLAAYSVSIDSPGQIFNINGTCEITMICLDRCLMSPNYNIRTHVLPDRWFSFYVMYAGGKAYEWFKSLFCSEMDNDTFFTEFVPSAIDRWLDRRSGVSYTPYLMGSRYSLEPLRAEFLGLTQETTREEMLAAMVRGLCQYQHENLAEVGAELTLDNTIVVSGGALNEAIIRAKQRWMYNCDYRFEAESSMRGAALLGLKYLQLC
jgi:xylulokinase